MAAKKPSARAISETPVANPAVPAGIMIENMTPRQIVAELDKYIVGQHRPSARWPSPCATAGAGSSSPPELAEDIAPKNILMIGPTGVGKTEIARRLARLAKAPFLKVEATKFTEVGYVGRDVESMVRDLVEIAVAMVKEEKRESVREAAALRAEDRLLELLVPPQADQQLPAAARSGRRGRRSRRHAREVPRQAARPAPSTTARSRSRSTRPPIPASRCSPRRASKRWG